jgi:hypothetical protein
VIAAIRLHHHRGREYLKAAVKKILRGHWSADVRSNFVAGLESYRRLPILLVSPDKALSKMTAS